jgi:DNA-binding transcriptional ArsR family regulator
MTYASAIDAQISAMADPTRRAIMDRLRAGPLAVQALADGLPVSRPAVSQHLKHLTDAGLLSVTAQGTRRVYAIRPDGVAALRTYLDDLWGDALTAFARAAESQAKGPP